MFKSIKFDKLIYLLKDIVFICLVVMIIQLIKFYYDTDFELDWSWILTQVVLGAVIVIIIPRLKRPK